ncbi:MULTISPECIES: fimbria/pilus periplasmic chaperone [Vibrio]|uniref:fimbria/pilus periplasmic chaperone n=1 Tax=Vibrio TaxID=662 RepID=UPI0010814C88|nr:MULTISPECIES: fimbria/pilus periplasmic chaperone [Vibrio]MCF7505195.1 fimbria/pilus periplasmic chaperone [Vibrio sp. L3-7]TVU76996.1 molecular chaperone [Vibrio tasmaniensis]
MKTIILIISLLLHHVTAFCYEITPMYQEMEEFGRKALTSYTINNTQDRSLPVEVVVYDVNYDETGEVLTLNEDSFLILPPQIMVNPLSSQKIRVRYIPSDALTTTKLYRIEFNELEVKGQEDKESKIKTLLSFSTLAFVSPNTIEPTMTTSIDNDKVVVENTSLVVVNLLQSIFELQTSEGTKDLPWNEIETRTSGYLMPGATAHYPIPDDIGNVTAISIKQKK